MKNQNLKKLLVSGMVAIFSGICINLSSQTGTGSVKLMYNYPSDKQITYLMNQTMTQTMDIQGQSMQIDVSSVMGCKVKLAGKQDNDNKLEIQIDTLGQNTNSPMGSSGGPIAGIKGKSFNITLTPEGKVVDLSGAEGLTYSVEGGGESNMAQNFSDFFTVLPSKNVAVGETWTRSDSVLTKSPAMTMKTIDAVVSKLEGFEQVNGMDCARISSQHTGTMTMNVQSQGMDIFIKGPFTGTSDCLFAVKEGYMVKITASTKLTGNLEMSSPSPMTMPIVIDIKTVNEMK